MATSYPLNINKLSDDQEKESAGALASCILIAFGMAEGLFVGWLIWA